MDNVEMSLNTPWEEEMAMVNYCRYSFYNVSFFPRDVERIFRDAVMFNGDNLKDVEAWKRNYLALLKKVQYTQPGKTLLLKNPANTARINQIRQLLPGSKFIFIHRNPYEVYTSTIHLYTTVQAAWGLQSIDRLRLSRHVLRSYRTLMCSYFDQRKSLSNKELVEVAYDDLESDPVATVKKIYQQLDLDGYEQAESRFIDYLKQIQHYKKNSHALTFSEKTAVTRHWKRTFAEFGYLV